MLFKDILDNKTALLSGEFDALFDEIIARQSHPCDLLLVRENGICNLDVYMWDNIQNLSPYMIGPGMEGHSEQSHYKFIHRYRVENVYKNNFDVYKNEVKWDKDKQERIRELKEWEGITIELEMLAYLKIWEADMFIKKLHQLVLLSKGLPYDWNFKIKESNRDKGATGKRDVLIRNVKQSLSNRYPNIHNAFHNAYRTQIRNAIAHSTYALMDRYISLNNFVADDPYSQLKNIPFDEWIDLFHDTLIIYNELIRFFRKIDFHYRQMARENGRVVKVRISRLHPNEELEYRALYYNGMRWSWNPE